MNFHIYREIKHVGTKDKVGYQHIGSTRFREDADAILAKWHSGYIVHTGGEMVFEKNLTK